MRARCAGLLPYSSVGAEASKIASKRVILEAGKGSYRNKNFWVNEWRIILALEMTYFIMGTLPESIKNLPESGNRLNQCMPRGRIYTILCRKEQLCKADKWNTSDHCTKVQIPLSWSKGIIQRNKTFPGQLAAKSLWHEYGTIICFFDIDKSPW